MKAGAMDRNADTAGWVSLGTLFGFLIGDMIGLLLRVPPWVAQIATSLFTMAAGVILVHFLKRTLNRRWPHKERKAPDEGDDS